MFGLVVCCEAVDYAVAVLTSHDIIGISILINEIHKSEQRLGFK